MSDGIQTRADGSRFIDLTPTWESIFPIYFRVLTEADAKGQAVARAELLRAARALDTHNTLAKEPATTLKPPREPAVEVCLVWAHDVTPDHSATRAALGEYTHTRGLIWRTNTAGKASIHPLAATTLVEESI